MAHAIAVLNAGSSSLKFRVYRWEGARLDLQVRGAVDDLHGHPRFEAQDASGTEIGGNDWPSGTRLGLGDAVRHWIDWIDSGSLAGLELAAVGHRVVHGGPLYNKPIRIDSTVIDGLRSLVPMAPLHLPMSLAPILTIRDEFPDLPQCACFDTAFHQTQPDVARRIALPYRYEASGITRYGFHGLSYEYIASVLPEYLSGDADGKVIVAHLGNGASLCAMLGRKSIATTMGFSPLDGPPMGTRCGAIDPGVLLYLLGQEHLDTPALEHLLWHESGLLGVSGISGDMRSLLASDDPRASAAIDLFVYRVSREIGSLAAALGGLDALVFTGGIGEHAAPVRDRIVRQAAWLGIDPAEPGPQNGPRLSRPGSRATAWVIATDEEIVIARQTAHLLDPIAGSASP